MDVRTYNFWFISGYMLIIGLLYATLAIIRTSKAFLKLHYYLELLLASLTPIHAYCKGEGG